MTRVPNLDLLTQAQAARIIGVSRPRVSVLVKEGRIPSYPVGRQVMILRTDAEKFRDTPRKPGRPPATAPQPAKGRRKG